MESLRRNFFNGVQADERNITWIKWPKVLASKKYGGLGVSSFYALNRALLFKWVWRFISAEKSLWCRFIKAMHGNSLLKLSHFRGSTWNVIMREVFSLKERGIDLISHCRIRLGDGLRTQFWNDVWSSVISTFRRPVRGGIESAQLDLLEKSIEGTILSTLDDRWIWDLNGEGVFQVKDVRTLLDDYFLPKDSNATRWVNYVPIKINVFAWKVFLDRLPSRLNLLNRGVQIPDSRCQICFSAQEDSSHLFFSCCLAMDVTRLVCRWWNVSWSPFPRMQTGLCGLAPSG
ncbi:RNA-directed DNA polymerase, eukaryota [Tanacetum coccineum]